MEQVLQIQAYSFKIHSIAVFRSASLILSGPLGGIGVSLLRGRFLHARYYAATFQGRLEGFLAPEARSLPEPGLMQAAESAASAEAWGEWGLPGSSLPSWASKPSLTPCRLPRLRFLPVLVFLVLVTLTPSTQTRCAVLTPRRQR